MSFPRILAVDPWNPDPKVIGEAAELLRGGRLVAFPTETVYGLGANGLDPAAAAKIYAAKGRPSDNPLILHFSSPGDAESAVIVNERARRLMDLFWPGPLTLVLPSRGTVPPEVTAGLDTVAVRMPSHPVALALIAAAGLPVAAPSANTSGRPSPTDAPAVASDLGDRVDLVLDGGPTSVGLESTVLDLTGKDMVLLRPGGCPVEEIESRTGEQVLRSGGNVRRSPGTRYRHYAPSVPLILHDGAGAREKALASGGRIAWLGMDGPEILFDPGETDGELSLRFSTPENYARALFHALRFLESSGASIIVAQRPGTDAGIALALRDRLERASSEEKKNSPEK
ncbi:MAG: L-threonylcarbamoyladenylate synthase [Synergistaceae bacterium]|nr:L-threonylcarbamoyladenylate synthase [Synergistaceae bacterium]